MKIARDGFDGRATSPAKALRLALAKAADALFDLAMTVATVEQTRVPQDALHGFFDDDALLVLLDGQGGRRGGAALDPQLVAALIEVQTMGRVAGAPVPAREMTRTDAAIAAPYVDETLRRFEATMQEAGVDRWATPYRFGDRVGAARALCLALEMPEYDVFRVSLDIAGGARTGQIVLVLPVPAAAPPADAAADRASEETHGAPCPGIAANVLGARATFDAVIARVSLPLDAVAGLRVGDVVPVTGADFDATDLVTTGNVSVAQVRLGQLNGARAVRMGGGLPQGRAPGPAAADDAVPDTGRSGAEQDQAGEVAVPPTGADGDGRSGETGNEVPALGATGEGAAREATDPRPTLTGGHADVDG
ncbi:FliM/FliN family flagellar motor C-terminal domain-containing protein [Roseovarius salinarum]|uniref:FliM/FliN family flagellar motor C-terminal domain-containing protein n=1 Tax=Roseovarius salinarum TaxID=1981892 RepID=UPI0012FFFB3D|nr:FliM/FliN family flagellar motor C-terminal domain-containing protein [Roseovarius salinarum]